jgi:23S rRNA (pseudouridine1915-N3)-methyltransferase
MKLRVLAVGTKPPAWIRSGFDEYAKRLPPETPLELIEIAAPKHRGSADKFVQLEGAKMTAQINQGDWVVALEENGRQVSSAQLAKKLEEWRMQGCDVTFLIGGSDGLSEAARQRANERMSLSALTLPHYLVRVIVAEALYRAWSISAGHPYHRA